MDPSASTFIVDGQLLRLKKVIQQKEALIGSLKHQKVQRAMAKEEARIDSKNAKTGLHRQLGPLSSKADHRA
jgi:hypothetical protein